MKIRLIHSNEEVIVYGIYWAVYQSKILRHYYIIPELGYTGFISITENECIVIDPCIYNFLMIKDDCNGDILIHTLAYQGDLLGGLIDHQPEAMQEFSKRLKENYNRDYTYLDVLPLDMLRKSKKYPNFSDLDGEYYFCPNCYEASQKKNTYDEAIKCSGCGVIYNCVT